ncbi:hypothetical protein ELH72_06330 [Rhizobium ruizarguesonis]|uniref:ParB N-terminal domain-containing protein n=1 Tax=Rhizobium ruizarguesonis TaxID=2081791 RepID=UPI001030F738|nr:ParB N-terminal domain-containing protein [Rhizobium ruizarguesonis]TAZ82896.1 hypothetical protein ELH72_06330 [Rhizobium ruizarguesonis]TBB22020.1 hypothetical protein ELH51_09920 [Rhizobium ruizarguesonis]
MTEEVISVSLDAVVLLPANQIRDQMCPRTVREYAELMRGGEKFVPVKVARVDATDETRGFVLVDGWHRVTATRRIGLSEIDAVVVTPSGPEEIPWLAAQANRKHGLPLTRLDRRNVFRAYIMAKKHRKGRGNAVKSAREMEKDLNGIVSRHQLPKWMQSDFPAIFAAMNGNGLEDDTDGGQGFKLADMDEGYAKSARAALSEYMACMRAMQDNRKARAVLIEAAAMVTEVSMAVTGKQKWPTAAAVIELDF